jgi:hypothetical protein
MYEKLLTVFSEKIHPHSGGRLHCLPSCRALVDFFSQRKGKPATALVVQCVVFGVRSLEKLREIWGNNDAFEQGLEAAYSNGFLAKTSGISEVSAYRSMPNQEGTSILPYRTIGVANHGENNEEGGFGSYDSNGAWLGHLVVIKDGWLLDPTIAQIASERHNIRFARPWLSAPTTEDFLAGDDWLLVEVEDAVIGYKAFPNEQSHKQSKSWSDDAIRKELRDIAKSVVQVFKGKSKESLN